MNLGKLVLVKIIVDRVGLVSVVCSLFIVVKSILIDMRKIR